MKKNADDDNACLQRHRRDISKLERGEQLVQGEIRDVRQSLANQAEVISDMSGNMCHCNQGVSPGSSRDSAIVVGEDSEYSQPPIQGGSSVLDPNASG